MRTTVDIDDDLLDRLRAEALRQGRSFREELNRAIHRGLTTASVAPELEPYRTPVFDLGPARPGIDLDKALAIADALADDETAQRLARRS